MWSFWKNAPGAALALAVTAGAAHAPREPAPAAAKAQPLLVAFYVPWEAPALQSLKDHVSQTDVFSPMWASLVSPAGEVRWESDPEAHAAIAAAARKPKVMPLVSNAHDDVWDVKAAAAVIADPAAGAAFADALAARAKAEGFAGYVLDFENLSPEAAAGYPAFVERLRDRLKASGREVWVTTVLSIAPAMQKALASAADAVVLMAYDQCWATSTPGPVADDAWLRANLAAKLSSADVRRYVVALAAYGYDWPAGKTAQVIAAPAAARRAAGSGAGVQHAPGSNAHLSYRAADGSTHEVWWADAADFARQRRIAAERGVRGVALWRMGLEDPALWTARAAAPRAAEGGAPADCEPLAAR